MIDTVNFPPRQRFNWGFHDATFDVVREREGSGYVRDVTGHFDTDYGHGYLAGVEAMKAAAERPRTSDAAWAAHGAK